jgi:hypothetical protein
VAELVAFEIEVRLAAEGVDEEAERVSRASLD